MSVHLRERELLAHPVAVPVVRVDVDRPLVEERLVQTVEPLANQLLLPLRLGDPPLRVGLELAPRIDHPVLHEPHEAGGRLQALQFLDEQVFELGLRDVHSATSAAAVVVRVVLATPLRPARGQRLATRLATDVAAPREVWIAALTRRSHFHAAVEDRLHPEEDALGDERFEVAAGGHAIVRDFDPSDVHTVPEHRIERLRRQRFTAASPESEFDGALAHFVLGVAARREILERSPHERSACRIWNQTLANGARRVQVAKRREKRPASEFECRLHPTARSLRAHVGVELRERGEHAFHQLTGGRVVDRLGRGAKRDPERLQMCAKCEVVVLLAGESRQVEDDDKLDPALVRPAEVQELLKLGAIGALRALAFFAESCDDVEPLALAVFLAGFELCGQTEILGLLLNADADVDHRTDHRWQLTADV